MKKETLSLIIIAGVIVFSIVLYFVGPQKPVKEKVVCTTDVKLCPDNSYVGRVPPDCKFLECPKVPIN